MEASEASHQIIAELLESRTGQHLTESRRWRVNSALAGIFRAHGISNVDQLVCLLASPRTGPESRDLSQEVVEALLNNETYFFRDKPTFDQLPGEILPELAARRQSARRLSIWSAGCSTGQEAYSIAATLLDAAPDLEKCDLRILATDIDANVIEKAKAGVYDRRLIGENVPAALSRFLQDGPGAGQVTVAPKLHFFDLSSSIHFAAPSCSKLHLSLVSDLRALVCIGRVSDCTAYNRFHSDLLLSPNQLY